jgi:hypothetical protein
VDVQVRILPIKWRPFSLKLESTVLASKSGIYSHPSIRPFSSSFGARHLELRVSRIPRHPLTYRDLHFK